MLQQILSDLPRIPVRERLGERCLAFLRRYAVPQELIDSLDECAHAGPIRIGPVSLSRLAELDKDNQDEAHATCIERGFLIVGSGLNGDAIAVDLASGTMAFVSHDILWEKAYDDFEECVVRTPMTFHEFWHEAFSSPNFPRDSRDAEERWSPRTDPRSAR